MAAGEEVETIENKVVRRLAVVSIARVRSFCSHEVNERLNGIGHKFTAITRFVVDVFGQEMSEVSAESLKFAFTDKIMPELRRLSAKVLNVGDVCGVSSFRITSENPLHIGQSSAETPTKVVTALDAYAHTRSPLGDV